MNNDLKIKLYMGKNEIVSDLKKKVYEEELNKINKKFPLHKDSINIYGTYFKERDSQVEVGVFFRNTLSNDVSLELIELALQDENNNIIAKETFNFKDIGSLPSYTGMPATINFTLKDNVVFDSNKDYKISFINIKEMKSFASVNTELSGIPIDIPYEEEKNIREFVNGLETLRENEVSLTVYRAFRTIDDGVLIQLIVRNGYNQDITVENLPVIIQSPQSVVLCKDIFSVLGGKQLLERGKATLINIIIPKEKLYNTVFDIDECKIMINK